jgi:hypothetical protein
MESQDDETRIEGDERAAYGANQEYDDDGNYPNPYYAMSAAMEHPQYYNNEDDQESENYAS